MGRLTAEFRSLETDEAVALDDLMAGADFSTLCERLFNGHPEDEAAPRLDRRRNNRRVR